MSETHSTAGAAFRGVIAGPAESGAIRARVLDGMARDRVPGFSFSGHFLDTTWPRIGSDSAEVSIPLGPHCADPDGRMELTALLMTLDAALATPTRLFIHPGERIATTHMHVQFTGAPVEGRLDADAVFEGFTQGDAVGQLLSRGVASAGGARVCHGSASFMRLPPPPGTRVLAPLPWQRTEAVEVPVLGEADLDERERAILARCDGALAGEFAGESFARRFWDIAPRRDEGGAVTRTVTGPHLANRVGHVQGGILLGLVAETARAAVPRHGVFSSLSAWFLSPGRGAALECRACIVHQGRSFAVVRTEITGDGGVRVMEAMSAHATAEPPGR